MTIVQGDGGDGKTTMMLAIAAMLSRGRKPPTMKNGSLLPSESCEPMNTFFASTEDEVEDSAVPRFLRNGGDINRLFFSREMKRHLLLKENDMRAVIKSSNAGLVIIDPVQSFLPSGSSMANVNAMRPIFTMLSNVAKDTGCAIVLIGHMNKNEGAKDIHRGLGSADIAASVRSILLVQKTKDRKMSIVQAIKSNFDESDYSAVGTVLDENRVMHFVDLNHAENPIAATDGIFDFVLDRADDIVEDDAVDTKPKQSEAINTAKELLAGGDLESSVFKELLTSSGINYRTFMRAKKEYGGFSSYRFEGKTYWTLE